LATDVSFGARTAAAMCLALTWASGSAADGCAPFAGREWEFTGHLVNRISPGPPNYESVTSGDKAVTRWYLQLRWPACFAEYRYLTRFQLALKPEEVDRYRPLLGKEVRVKGTLEEGAAGLHTTALVVHVSSVDRIRRY
jgi:Domain of unknown function (DUF4431)